MSPNRENISPQNIKNENPSSSITPVNSIDIIRIIVNGLKIIEITL
jgi:hypothetical protein